MTTLKITLMCIGFVWVLSVAAITLLLTMASKRGREMEREHDLDERMGEE
jgi:hypothetical protein